MVQYYGFNPPIFGGHQNILSRQVDEQLIKNDILQLLLTTPGERVMRPDFGTILKSSVFDLNDRTLLNKLRDNILQAIRTFEPRVTTTVRVTSDGDQTVNVSVYCTMVNDVTREFLVETSVLIQSE